MTDSAARGDHTRHGAVTVPRDEDRHPRAQGKSDPNRGKTRRHVLAVFRWARTAFQAAFPQGNESFPIRQAEDALNITGSGH